MPLSGNGRRGVGDETADRHASPFGDDACNRLRVDIREDQRGLALSAREGMTRLRECGGIACGGIAAALSMQRLHKFELLVITRLQVREF